MPHHYPTAASPASSLPPQDPSAHPPPGCHALSIYLRSLGTCTQALARVPKLVRPPSPPQEEIHTLLLAFAEAGATVIRLKGGDPYVYGRGGEEVRP